MFCWINHLVLRTKSTAPPTFAVGRYSQSSFTPCKLRLLRSVRTQLSAVRDGLKRTVVFFCYLVIVVERLLEFPIVPASVDSSISVLSSGIKIVPDTVAEEKLSSEVELVFLITKAPTC